MAFKDKAGKNFNSKFRSSRSDRENAVNEGMKAEKPSGNRSEANAIEAKGTKGKPMATGAGDDGGPVNAAAGGTMNAKAKEVHITHDHVSGVHHVSATMEDGTTQDSDHSSPEEAHFHGATMAGVAAGGENPEGEYPMKHKHPEGEAPDADDYDVEPLD